MSEISSEFEKQDMYWRANLRLLCVLLSIWCLVSYGCGIVFVEELNQINLPGTAFPLGFWFAQQGAVFVFVALIFFYAYRMDKLDRAYGVAED